MTTEATVSQTEATAAPADGVTPAAAPSPAPAAADKPARPEWIPEKFWDADGGAPRVEDLAKSYQKLESIHGSAEKFEETIKARFEEERRAGLPQKPEEYTPELPQELWPEGTKGEINTDDPLVKFWQQTAHKYGLSKDDFSAGVAEFIKADMAARASIKEEVAKLGENAEARVKAVDTWLASSLDKEAYGAFAKYAISADFIRGLEVLMQKSGGTVPANDDPSATTSGSGMTIEQLKELQKDPRYWKHGDKEIVEKVQAGYRALFPGKRQ
jgi:hypothetical protein